MKHIFLLSIIAISTLGCTLPERNCSKFRTGTFEFESILNGELVKTTFIRNDSIEIDYFQGKSDTSSAIHMKILTTNQNMYTFEYALVGNTNKQHGTAKKIK